MKAKELAQRIVSNEKRMHVYVATASNLPARAAQEKEAAVELYLLPVQVNAVSHKPGCCGKRNVLLVLV